MKRGVFVLLLMAGVALSAFSLPNPLAYYSFESEAKESTAVSLMGKARLSPGGIAGAYLALAKDPATFASLGRGFGFAGDFSLSLWVRIPKGFSEQMSFVLSRHDAGWVNGYFLQVNFQNGIGADNKITFYYSGNWIASKSNINDGAWHHVAVSYKVDRGAELYFDGKKEAEGRSSGPLVVADAQFLLGGLAWWGGKPVGNFEGDVDELRIFGSAISAEDAAALSRPPQKQPGSGFYGDETKKPADSGGAGLGGLSILRIRLVDGRSLEIPFDLIAGIDFVR